MRIDKRELHYTVFVTKKKRYKISPGDLSYEIFNRHLL